MFNLEQAITDWRRQMVKVGIQTPAPMEELESHLREDIEQQQRAGLNDQQAFDLAVQRVGQAGALKNEFTKTNVYGQPLSSQYLRLYCYTIAPFMLAVSLGMWAMGEISPIQLAGGILLAFYTGGLPRWHWLLANARSRWGRAVLKIGWFFVLPWPLWSILGLLPSGIVGDMIFPAWAATMLACFVCRSEDTVMKGEPTSGPEKRQYV